MTEFVHLRGMTRYTPRLGALQPAGLVDAAIAIDACAMTLSDRHGIYGAVEFAVRAWEVGLRPIIAAEMVVQERPLGGPSVGPVGTLLLLASTATGLSNLARLSSIAWTRGWTGREPRLDLATLAEYAAGLVVIAGGPESVTGQRLAGQRAGRPVGRIRQLCDIFDRDHLFIEVQRGDEEALGSGAAAVELARQAGVRPVATADCRCGLEREGPDWLPGTVAIDPRSGRRRLVGFEPAHRVVGPEEMAARFADLPDALANTLRIAAMIDDDASPVPLEMQWSQQGGPGGGSAQHRLSKLAGGGLSHLLDTGRLDATIAPARYWRRLNDELAQIEIAGCAEAYLTAADLARQAHDRGMAIGPGSGLTGSSLVCRAVGLSELDPVACGLIFERHLPPGAEGPLGLVI